MSHAPHRRPILKGLTLDQIVNVASVPLRSPFRYPGGKTWLVPRIRQWLRTRPAELIEPFAGGGIVSLTAAAENLAAHVTMVELDAQVAAVWQTVINDGDARWLADRIINFDLTAGTLAEALKKEPRSVRERAFQTVLKNRTYRGGILAPGSAPLKRGEGGKGIKSRWYAETLRKRILEIDALRARITFVEGDGVEVVRAHAHDAGTFFFIDPPYTAGGKRPGRRLYTHSDLDHGELFRVASRIKGDFLMTYDDAEGVRALAEKHGFDTELVAMKTTHHAKTLELLIGPDLGWLRAGGD